MSTPLVLAIDGGNSKTDLALVGTINILALLGVGSVFIADFDTVDVTNFSRSVFFRPGDEGQRKAEVRCAFGGQVSEDGQGMQGGCT